ncbi:MAG TPA: rhodanese-like domain-containing protein [Verrucomicrobiae bacterium]|nr:rhodanese-like domain-containing protein [Verrucomicrobiae bacterium]
MNISNQNKNCLRHWAECAGGAVLASLLGAFTSLQAQSATLAQLQQRLAQREKLTIIDVRSPVLYAQGHVPGAINIPASLCSQKKLPPLGAVVVYDSGLGINDSGAAEGAAAQLGKLPGIHAETLAGGYAAWEEAHLLTTKGQGARREALHYITYAQLKTALPGDVVLVDLRRQPKAASVPGSPGKAALALTDLSLEFPGCRVMKSAAETRNASSSGKAPLVVFIDSTDGTAESSARLLKAGGTRHYAILAGGEAVLARKGERGLERSGTGALSPRRANKPSRPSS